MMISNPSTTPEDRSEFEASRGAPLVLVVDDDPVITHLVASVLDRNGLPYRTARTGSEAIDCAPRIRPDIVVLDIKLPDLNGFEVLEKLKAEPSTAAAPVIMLSSSDRAADVGRGFSLGAEDYIVKPPSETDLLDRIYSLNLLRKLRQLAQTAGPGDSAHLSPEELNCFLHRQGPKWLPNGVRHVRIFFGRAKIFLFAYLDFSQLLRSLSARRRLPPSGLFAGMRPTWIEASVESASGTASVALERAEIGGKELNASELELLFANYVVDCLPPLVGQRFGLWPGVDRILLEHRGVSVVAGERPPAPENGSESSGEPRSDRDGRKYWQ